MNKYRLPSNLSPDIKILLHKTSKTDYGLIMGKLIHGNLVQIPKKLQFLSQILNVIQ